MLAKRKILLTAVLICALVIVLGFFGIRTFAAEGNTTDNGAVVEGTNTRPDGWENFVLKDKYNWFNSTAAGIGTNQITKVFFSNTVPTGYTASWDASNKGNNGVIAYIVGTEVTIVGNGGQIILQSCSRMFEGFSHLVSVEGFEILDTADVTDMSYMFASCNSLNSPGVSGFDTGNVTDMRSMFSNCNSLSSLDLSEFDTGNVTNMSGMFSNCHSLSSLDVSDFDTGNVTNMAHMFNQCYMLSSLDVSNWNTGNVTSMFLMFKGCGSLSSLDVSSWNTGNVTSMGCMFYECRKLSSLDVSNWNTGKVTDMGGMFYYCQNLSELDVSGFDTGNVTNMGCMFYECRKLSSLDVSGFDTSNVIKMGCLSNSVMTSTASGMFGNCLKLTELDVSGFDTSSATDISGMFRNCQSLSSIDVSGFDTGNATDMSYMFHNCTSLSELDVSNFDTGKVTDMCGMFYGCSGLSELDISGFSTGNVKKMYAMFEKSTGLSELDVSSFDTGKVTDMSRMFYGCTGLSELDVSNWNTTNVTNMNYMFNACTGLSELDVSGFDTGNVNNMRGMFCGCTGISELDVSNWNTGKVTNMRSMFDSCTVLSELDVSGFDTGKVTDMGSMFEGCSTLSELDVSGFATGNVTDMGSMFCGCSSLSELDINGWNTGNVTSMYYMFDNCTSLSELDVSSWNTGNVTSMNRMFNNCTGLSELDVSNWNTTNVTNMNYMFNACTGLSELDVSGFDTGNVNSMRGMFYGCTGISELDVSNWNTGKVTNMRSMFSGCTSLSELDVSGWNTGSVTDMDSMFYGCTSLSKIDVSSFATGNVTYMSYMFSGCSSLDKLDLSSFDTGKVTQMDYMFSNCSGLTELDISGWNMGSVTNIIEIFCNCDSLKTILADDEFTMASGLYGYKCFYSGQSLAGGNGEKYKHLFMQYAISAAVCDCHETPGFLTYNGTDKCVVNYDLNYEGAPAVDFTQQVKQGKSVTVGGAEGQVPNPTRTKYEFLGWGTSPNATEVYSTGDGVPTNSASMTLYAQWKRVGFTVTIDWQDGEGIRPNTKTTMDVLLGRTPQNITVPVERDKYGFRGIYSEPNGQGELYVNENGTWCKPWDGTEDMTLYAFWVRTKYTVTIDWQDGEGIRPNTKTTMDVLPGTTPEAITVPVERDKYGFCGIYSEPNGQGKLYVNEDGSWCKPWDGTEDMTLYAQWKRTRCTITIDWQDGDDTRPNTQTTIDYYIDRTPENVTVPVERDKYVFRGIYSEPNGLGKLYVNSDGTWYRAWDGTEDTTLYAFWSRKDRDDYFWDVLRTDWFYDDVYFMYDRGLMLGIGNSTTFGPGESLTRSQFVTILYRMAHSPEGVEYETRFPDVPEGEWFATPVLWAYKNGIVNGYSTGYFGPADAITREQLAVMLYNYVSWKGGFDMTGRADLSGFEDADKVSDWAYDAVSWAVAEGIISGKGGTRLDPQGFTARCECSAMVQRYCDAAK